MTIVVNRGGRSCCWVLEERIILVLLRDASLWQLLELDYSPWRFMKRKKLALPWIWFWSSSCRAVVHVHKSIIMVVFVVRVSRASEKVIEVFWIGTCFRVTGA